MVFMEFEGGPESGPAGGVKISAAGPGGAPVFVLVDASEGAVPAADAASGRSGVSAPRVRPEGKGDGDGHAAEADKDDQDAPDGAAAAAAAADRDEMTDRDEKPDEDDGESAAADALDEWAALPARGPSIGAAKDQGSGPGVLVLAGTPIGDLRDAAPRLAAELSAADVIAAEDTRRLRRLARELGIKPAGRIVSYFEANEAARTPDLVARLADGARIVLVTDAGMPSVSDPGYRLVAAAVAAGLRVTAVPGPSAVLTALALSGLPVDRFCFEGFPPRKPGERGRVLAANAAEPRTMVYFEAPHRLAATLAAMAEAFGAQRPAAVCRELTKTYEEVKRGPLGELAAWAGAGVRGEITVVVGGAPAVTDAAPPDAAELAARVARREAAGELRKAAIAAVAVHLGAEASGVRRGRRRQERSGRAARGDEVAQRNRAVDAGALDMPCRPRGRLRPRAKIGSEHPDPHSRLCIWLQRSRASPSTSPRPSST